MSGAALAYILLLMSAASYAKQDAASLWSEGDEAGGPKETKVFTIESVLSTVVNTVYHTVRVFPTCTTTAKGVSACASGEGGLLSGQGLSDHTSGLAGLLRRPVLHTQAPSAAGEGESSTFSVAEMVLPSCDCGTADGRSPRRLQANQFITIRSTTTLTEHSVVTRTDPSTTVSITYDGCVPADALITAACHR
ncbi:uncharacterized protein [Panulirus ornatus]